MIYKYLFMLNISVSEMQLRIELLAYFSHLLSIVLIFILECSLVQASIIYNVYIDRFLAELVFMQAMRVVFTLHIR